MKWPWQAIFDVEQFRSENWLHMNDSARVKQLQALENDMARAQGRKPRIVISDASIPDGGYYAADGKGRGSIHVSENDLHNNSFECVDTVLHEGRHAYQDDVINNRIPHTETKDTKRAWAHDDTWGCYISSSEGSYCDYFYQPQEIDAYDFARGKMDEMSSHFLDDPWYQNYVTNRDYNREMARAEGMQKYGANTEQGVKDAVRDKVEDRYQSHPYSVFRKSSTYSDHGNRSSVSDSGGRAFNAEISGQKPDVVPMSPANEFSTKAGRLPGLQQSNPENANPVRAGTLPGEKQDLDLSKQGNNVDSAGKDLANGAGKKISNGVDAGAGIV